MNNKIADKLNEEKFQHLDRVHDLYFELEPDLEYDDEACEDSHSHAEVEQDLKDSFIHTADLDNFDQSVPQHSMEQEDDLLIHGNSLNPNDILNIQKRDRPMAYPDVGYQYKLQYHQNTNRNYDDNQLQASQLDSQNFHVPQSAAHQQLVTADPNIFEFQSPVQANDQQLVGKEDRRNDEPIFYSNSPKRGDLERQLQQQIQPNPYDLMKLIESARQSPTAKQKLIDAKQSLSKKKGTEAYQTKKLKKPQLTANENTILSNFKEKLIEQMDLETNKNHFSKKQKHKPNKFKDHLLDTSHSTTRIKRENEKGTGTGTTAGPIDTDPLGIVHTGETFDSGLSDNTGVLAAFKKQQKSLGAGFGLSGPQMQIKRKEHLIDSIMKEKMLKKGLSSYDPNMVSKIATINKKVKDDLKDKIAKNQRNKSVELDERGRTMDQTRQAPRELTMQERELQKEKRRVFRSFFSSLTKGNIEGTRKAMKRKYDELYDLNNTKQAKLDKLYLELGQVAFVNLEDQINLKSHRDSAIKEKAGSELYQGKPYDTIMDCQSTQKVFDYANLKSIVEHREVLQTKLELSQKRLKESETERDTYNQILLSLKHREIDDQKAQAKMSEKERDISQIIEDVQQVKKLEDERKYNFKQLQQHYKKKLVVDHQKMNKILDEKQEIQTYQDIETQHTLHNLLQRVREIKSLNKTLHQLEQAKNHQQTDEDKIMEVFRKRQEEFEVIKVLQQLNKMRKYQLQIDKVMSIDLSSQEQLQSGSCQIDFIRIEGLKLVDQLKGSIKEIQQKDKAKSGQGQSGGVSRRTRQGRSIGSKRSSQNSLPYKLRCLSQNSSMSSMTEEPCEEFNYERYLYQRIQYETMLQMDQSLLNLNADGIIKTFQQSNITINSLRNAFRQYENDKIDKFQHANKMQQELNFLENEAELVKQFLQQLTEMTYSAATADVDESENLNLKSQLLKYPLSPEGMNLFLDQIDIKSKGVQRFHSTKIHHLREFVSGLKFFLSLTLKKILLMHLQGQNCIEFDDKDSLEIQVMNTKYNAKKRRKKFNANTSDRQSPENNSGLDFQKTQAKSRGASLMSRFSKGFEVTSGIGSRQSPNSQINSQDDSLQSKKTDELTQEQLDTQMIDYDLPNLVNILLNGHMNGFRVDNGFKRKRDSCSHTGSQADSAKSRQLNNQAQLDISEFDPIYRKSDFKQVRKNVNMVLLGEYARVVGTKQWEVLRQQGKERVLTVHNSLIQDDSQKEFLKLGTQMKKDRVKAMQAEEERLLALEDKGDDDDDMPSQDSLEMSEPKKKDMNKERKDAADRLAQLKLLDKNENNIIKNELYKQKHKVQKVQRSEKYFIEDLKHKISARYQTLRDQFDSIYDTESIQRSRQNRSISIKDWDLSQASIGGFIQTNKKRANFSMAPDSIHISPKNSTVRESLVERQSKTGTGNRPVCVKKNGLVVPNMSLQKRNMKEYNDYIRQTNNNTTDGFMEMKFHSLNKDLVTPPNEYSTIDPLDNFKAIRSVCFEMSSKRTPATASLKQRIKMSKQMTDSLQPESVGSDMPQQNGKHYRKFNKSVNDYDKFMKQTPYSVHSHRGPNQSDIKNIPKFAVGIPKHVRPQRLNASLDPSVMKGIKKIHVQPNYMNLAYSPIYKGPHHAYEQAKYQDHLFKKYILRQSQATEKEGASDPEISSNANLFQQTKPQTAAINPRNAKKYSYKVGSPTKVYNKNRIKQHVNFDLQSLNIRPLTQDGNNGIACYDLNLKQQQQPYQMSPTQHRGLNSTNHNSKSIDSSESRTRMY